VPRLRSRPAPGEETERPPGEAPPRRRLGRGLREPQIVEVAADFFAERGFEAPTRELADRLGVTQALLYRYFRSKEQLLERVLEQTFGGRRPRGTIALLRDRSRPLDDRLSAFYQGYFAGVSATSIRLFVRGGLEGRGLAGRFSGPLTEKILYPVVEELRHDVGLPDAGARPLMRGERELAMTLHGGLMFLAVRKFIYGMPMPDDLSDLVALQIRVFLPGARAEIARLHAPPDQPTLTVRQLDRRGR
jgi:AcrR family transcriptional regulator